MPKKIGGTIALIAVIFAILVGVIEATNVFDISTYAGTITIVLVIAGIIIGGLNIKRSESVPFMVAALVIAGGATALAVLPGIGSGIQVLFTRVATLIIPAAIVVSLMTAYKKIK